MHTYTGTCKHTLFETQPTERHAQGGQDQVRQGSAASNLEADDKTSDESDDDEEEEDD
jgi:hypothetical protein